MSGKVQEISSAIKDIVASGGHVSGSRLSAHLKDRIPTWNPAEFGVRNLREFVAAHVPEVVAVGRSGMDVIYGLGGSQPHQAFEAPLAPSPADFWRVWVSPNSPVVLAVDRTSAAVRTSPRGTPAAVGEVLLEPPSVAVHRGVAREFLARVPDEIRPRLQAALDTPSEQWWQVWLRELRGSVHLSTWNSFRRDAFEQRLRSQLQAATFNEDSIERVLSMIRERHASAPLRTRRVLASASVERIECDELRRVVVEAVQRMSAAELRDLRLPIGIVLDVLASSKSR